MRKTLAIALVVLIFISIGGCRQKNQVSENASFSAEKTSLTETEIKDIIHNADKAAVEVLNLALQEKLEGITKPPFDEVRSKLSQYYSDEIIERLRTFYESNCEGWGDLGDAFPYWKEGVIEGAVCSVIERTPSRVKVTVEREGWTEPESYTLVNKDGRWLISNVESLKKDVSVADKHKKPLANSEVTTSPPGINKSGPTSTKLPSLVESYPESTAYDPLEVFTGIVNDMNNHKFNYIVTNYSMDDLLRDNGIDPLQIKKIFASMQLEKATLVWRTDSEALIEARFSTPSIKHSVERFKVSYSPKRPWTLDMPLYGDERNGIGITEFLAKYGK
ncbi:IseA DL-endopeptidase inhibitor family protein [Desulfofundulus thermocisternus]|uniref:IseA DL-endopeptidase inhibitor family protein n=1 Tax=Desulfofundulus thermocisternus TaxID=42471 RepID=UPI00217DC7EF|nr:IseA DL-endopeptidase inhibitor family protein [Desulfofundulus thermocisternus]